MTMMVSLTVNVTVYTPSGVPAVGVPLRVVIDRAPVSEPSAGQRCITDAKGECHLTVSVALDERQRKMPTNWVGSLTARKQRTRHVAFGVEMAYAGQPWLSVIDVDRFDDGASVQLEGLRAFGRDASGQFTVAAKRDERGALYADMPGGLRLSLPGFTVQRAELSATSDPAAWTMTVSLQQLPEPIRRD